MQLQFFLRESINPQKLAGQRISGDAFLKWKSFLNQEIALSKLNIESLSLSSKAKTAKELQLVISQICDLSNLVNRYIIKSLPVWAAHASAREIKTHYLFTCIQLENFLSDIYSMFPAQQPSAKITNFSLPEIKMQLKARHKKLTEYLNKSSVEEDLKSVFNASLNQLINKKKMTHGDLHYLIQLLSRIQNSEVLETESFTNLLVRENFNLPEFFMYCVHKWQEKMNEIPGLHEQKEMIIKEKGKLYDGQLNEESKSNRPTSALYHDLHNFLHEKSTYVGQLIKIRQEAVLDLDKVNSARRFKINLPVPQLGLFIRMQLEKGILAKESIGELFAFYATHFYTANVAFISADSLQKKSTDVEFSTAQKMKGHLIGMLNWINAHYNLSNYN